LIAPGASAGRILAIGFFLAAAALLISDQHTRPPSVEASTLYPRPVLTAPTPTLENVPAAPEPPATEHVVALAIETWPEDPVRATRVLYCESRAGQDPRTYDTEAANGGPYQLNRDVWAPFFQARFGWTWETVVKDVDVHMRAARIVYERGGGWDPWACA